MWPVMAWGLACGGLLQRCNGLQPDRLGGGDLNSAELQRDSLALLDDWSVKDTAGLRATLQGLFAGGDRAKLFVQAQRHDQFLAAHGHDNEFAKEGFQQTWLAKHRHQVGARSLLAWDAGRAAAMVSWGYATRLIGEIEAWHYLIAIARATQPHYASWYEFGEHYWLGYEWWSQEPAHQKQTPALELCTEEGSPWRTVPWSAPLDIPGFSVGIVFQYAPLPAAPRPTRGAAEAALNRPPAERFRAARAHESDGAFYVRDSSGQITWEDGHDLDLLPSQWADDWGPIGGPSASAIQTCQAHHMTFREYGSRPNELEGALRQLGYRSVGQYFRTQWTVGKYYGQPGQDWTLQTRLLEGPAWNQGAMNAFVNQQASQHAAAFASNPGLLAPIHGATFELYAEVSARAAELSEPAFSALLAKHGVDVANWRAADRGWTERIQRDSSGALANKLTELLGKYRPANALDPASVSFDKYCEISGAIGAWSELGVDSNAEIEKVFGMTMLDYGNVATHWSNQMMADVSLMTVYGEKLTQYQERYQAARPSAAAGVRF